MAPSKASGGTFQDLGIFEKEVGLQKERQRLEKHHSRPRYSMWTCSCGAQNSSVRPGAMFAPPVTRTVVVWRHAAKAIRGQLLGEVDPGQ